MIINDSYHKITNSYHNLYYCPSKVVIDDFNNFKLPQWFLIKLMTECEELHIFMQYQKIFYKIQYVKMYKHIDKYAKILGIKFNYISEYSIHKKEKIKHIHKINQNAINTELTKLFDLRKFFNDNIDVITDLSFTYNNKEYISHIDFDVILSKNRFQRVLFIRQLLIYLLCKSNFSCTLIGKMLERDHTTVLNARDFFTDFVEIYFSEKDKEILTKLRQNLLTQLKNKDVIINT